MSPPASKKRKTERVSRSDEDYDSGSFASFGSAGDSGKEEDGVRTHRHTVTAGDTEDIDDEADTEGISNEDEGFNETIKTMGRSSETSRSNRDNGTMAPHARPRSTARSAIGGEPGTYTAGTYKSNVFKLQSDHLLAQLRPRQGKREAATEDALHALRRAIQQIPPRPSEPIAEAESHLLMSNRIAIPFPHPRPAKDAKYKLEYAKPAGINVVGSYALKIASRVNDILEIDMLVQMPSKLFQEKDYLNHRYFYKRAYYIACVAGGLEIALSSAYDFHYSFFADDPLKPILVVTPVREKLNETETSLAPKWQINIVPAIAEDVFPSEKLQPWKNCVRNSAPQQREVRPVPSLESTPVYNASLRADMLFTPYLKLLHGAGNSCAAFRDACLLGGKWLRQRQLSSGVSTGGFGNFEWSALMALLLHGGRPDGNSLLSSGYSSYQLFKATLQLLASKDFSNQSMTLGHGSDDKASGSPVSGIWDTTRRHNLLYKMSPWSYNFLRSEARTTLNMLNDQHFDGFEAAFITKSKSLLVRYDKAVELSLQYRKGEFEILDGLYETLRRGLGDRARLINFMPSASPYWALRSAPPHKPATSRVTVGISLDPENANRTVDYGPSAESKNEAASFRKFWGEKAELRRYKDGSILESLLWDSKSNTPILEQILGYLLARHIGDAVASTAKFSSKDFIFLLPHQDSMAPFHEMMEAYKQLENDIRGLDGLPLSIRQIMPASPQLCYTSVSPPLNASQRPLPANVTLQFEGSGRWPDDLVAIQRTKLAFLLKLSQLFDESLDTASSRVGQENPETDMLNQAFLDVSYRTGAAFRIRIHHEREMTLFERQLKDKTLDPRTKELASLGLFMHKRDYLRKPAHTQAIARLCTRYPALSGTIRLTKKWFASHLLDARHLAEEIIELFVVRAFLQPWPYNAPSSVQTGFLRTLTWLSKWDWRADPLIVDLTGDSKASDVQATQTRFEAWRKLDPAMHRVSLFVASSIDIDGTTYTDNQRPAKVVAGRMTALARAACAEFEEKGLELDPASLFSSSLADFDFILHLGDSASTGHSKYRKQGGKKAQAFKNLDLAALDDTDAIGFDPVNDFVEELERSFGHAALFFCGGGERTVIAGLWSPLTERRAWKVNLAYSTTPIRSTEGDENTSLAEANKAAMLAEMARLGAELVEEIEVNKRL